MRTVTTAVVVAAVLLAGCSRDLDLPAANRLAFAQPFRTAAPRQVLTDLQVAGGAGGYAFAFAEGGRLSGEDATVDPATGAYQAGRRGSAQDVVQVRDASGATATVRISVGAPLSVSPPIGGTAPGGELAFTVSGGLPPYAFAIPLNRSGAPALVQAGASVRYTAGPTGSVVDGLRVSDATLDPAASATVEVSVGVALAAFPSARIVAPHDSATVVGTGGAPPYTYRVSTQASGPDATITATGFYTAGGVGDVTDELEVRDAHGQTATFLMQVGPPLALALDGSAPDPRPGVPMGLTASGGKPPYAYRFVRGGNRSGGTVDGTTGVYVPGPASGAVDLFEVTDQTGKARARVSNPTPIGAWQLQSGNTNRVCAAGDLDGDGVDDLLVGNDRFTRLGAVLRIGTGQPRTDSYAMTGLEGDARFLTVEDLDGDGRAEVLLGNRQGVRSFIPDPLGQLAPGPEYTQAGDPAFRPGEAIVRAATPTGPRFVTGQGGGPGAPCALDHAVALRWDPASATSLALACLPAPGYPGGQVVSLAAGDLDGDGAGDLALLRLGAEGRSDGNLYVAWGDGAGAFEAVALATTIVPAGFTWPVAGATEWASQYNRFVPVPAVDGRAGGLLVRVEDGAGRGQIVTARVDGITRAWTVNGPYDLRPDWPGPWGFVAVPRAALQGAERLHVGYNLVDGHLLGVVLDAVSLVPHAVQVDPGPRASRIDCVAFPDANADGARDLVAVGQFMPTSDLLPGSGASDVPRTAAAPWFGERVHRRGLGFPAGTADLDGDGLTDAVAWDGSGLAVLLGGDGQLGSLQRLTSVLTMGISAGPLFAPEVAGTVVVFHDHQQTFYAALPDGRGGFDPPYALTLTQAGGGTFGGSVFGFRQVELGGPALFTSGAVFLPRGRGDLLAVPMAAHAAGDAEVCAYTPAGRFPAGATTATVLMACAEARVPFGNECDVAIYRSAVTGLDGPAPVFGGWTQLDRQVHPSCSAPVVMANTMVGGAPPLDGDPFFGAWDPVAEEYRIITFEPGLAPTTQRVPLPGARIGKEFGGAVPVALRPGAPEDLLVTTADAVLLLRRGGDGRFAVVQRVVGGLQVPLGAGRLAHGAPPFVITAGEGIFADDAGTELVPVPTAGGFLE